ncbi:vitelline membrane outer layer protein 1-like [Neoarius graeffei]|uniref:vitelline membrane outer layer protein 1-like n=1 Tax=Neoarius graeffei TaxID=443677 RepID=UPI00298C5B56|nr:vitelline membrane outer layer protein 1-like [Neoarius graeffei]
MALVYISILCLLSLVSSVEVDFEAQPYIVHAGTAFVTRNYTSVLTVPNGEQFGDWMWSEMCPENFYATGFSLRVESNQYGTDDTALNGIRLFCVQNGDRSFLYSVESHAGHFGEWMEPQWCPSGTLTSFQLRVEPHQGIFGDDTSANNIRFRCSSNPTLEGRGMSWGDYGAWSEVCHNGGICGIQTKMESYQGALDDSSLNDVRFYCCTQSQQ